MSLLPQTDSSVCSPNLTVLNRKKSFVLSLAALLLALCSLSRADAQLLSVDINGPSGDANKGANKPGYMPWYMADQTGAGIRSATQYFTNYVYAYDTNDPYGPPIATNVSLVIPCTVTMTYPSTASATNYLFGKAQNKAGYSTSTDPNDKWRLCVDGVMSYWKDDTITVDQPNVNGGAISLTISNLPAGDHTVTTYHNNPWAPPLDNAAWHAGLTNMSRYIISANGVTVFTNTPSFGCTNDNLCSSAFFHVTNSYNGQPVVINFAPDHSGQLDFVILNGFEIDRAFAPGMEASVVYPLPGDEHAFASNDQPLPNTANSNSVSLQWTAADFAVSNIVYFGTNMNAVSIATPASPEFKRLSSAIAGATNSLVMSNLNNTTTYYWRVDQLDIANGVTNVVPGTVWSFRTRHLAFPGAEGYGRFSRGGRGGRVIEVTNLNDSGPGSYRAAIEATGPRTVVFRVSGLIRLNGPCVVGSDNGYLTVAGQTAPGDGICIANYRAGLAGANDVTMRFMRCRLGDAAQKAMDGIGLGNSTHSIIDHTSISWTMDEATSSRQSGSVGSQSAMITFQNNLISEPLRHSYHYAGQSITSTNYEEHAFAGSISGEIGSYHRNLIAHSTDRNWSLAGGLDQSVHYAGSLDIRNCVVYNFKGRTTDGGVARLNYVNNYYKPAPVNFSKACSWLLRYDAPNTNWGMHYAFMTNNVWEGRNYYTNNWMPGSFQNGLPMDALTVTNAEIFPSYVDTLSASNAYKVVTSDSGCNLQLQDLIDKRVIGEVLDGTTHYIGTNGTPYIVNGVVQYNSDNTAGFIDTQTDVRDYQSTNSSLPNYSVNAPWGPYATYNVPLDTDHDGMPDWWERIKGFNTNSPAGDFSDSNSDADGDGYTALEDYLNWLAKPHYDCTNGVTLNVDLTQYTRGFTNSSLGSTYTVFNATGGTIGLSGRTAQFTPNTGVDSLGSFYFKVSDNTGFSYTNYVNVHILSNGSLPGAPSTPTGLNATAGDTQVSLSWTAASGATSYIVKRSVVDGGPYTSIVTNASTSYANTGLANGTTYYYVVSAVNAVGESPDSTQVSATPQLALPGVPAGLAATAGNSQVALSWNISSGATSYIVKRATVNGGPYASVVTNATTTFTNTGLANGTTYYFVVSAVNAAGESANSTQVSATPQIAAPTGLGATAGDSQVSLSWSASVGATNYIVKRSTINGGPYTSVATNATTTFVNTGLLNGITYFYVISALGSGGESANSGQISATPIGSGPSALYAYEGFNYPANTSIANQSGGTGWGATWGNIADAASALGTNAASGLTYGNATKQLVTSGGCMIVGNPVGASSTTAQVQRQLSKTLTNIIGGGGSVWISFLYQNIQTNKGSFAGYRETGIRLMSGSTTNALNYSNRDGTDRMDVGSPNTYSSGANFDELSVFVATTSTYVHNGYTTPRGTNPTNVVFVVMRLDVNTSTNLDNAYTWFFQNGDGLSGEPNTGSALLYTAADLSGVNALRFQAGNGNGNGTNAFWALDEIRVGGTYADVAPVTTIGSGNTAPSLTAISNRTLNVGAVLNITNSATDSDTPAQTLTYTLPISPTNASIGSASGILNWRPLVTQANSTNQFSVVVADNGSPSLSATQNFSVIVNPLTVPTITSPTLTSSQIGFVVTGQTGPDYAVQSSTNLTDWSTLLITNPATMPFSWSNSTGNLPAQFYRIKVGPPLP